MSSALDMGLLPQKYDPVADQILFIRFGEADLRAASFLDDRVLKPGMEGFWTPVSQVPLTANANSNIANFIFHAGHTGSTLLSRLLGNAPSVLPLREPLPLRTLAELHDDLDTPHALIGSAGFHERLNLFLRLWCRGPTRSVLIKATSTVGRIAPVLLEAQPASKAIYLSLSAEAYLATLLAGANAMIDLRGHAPERNRRLERILGEAPLVVHQASIGELAAMAWLVEKFAQQALQQYGGERVLSLDFDAMLQDLDGILRHAANHLGVPMPERPAITAIMGRYSKGPEHAYTPGLRAQLLAQARVQHAGELRKGLSWLERMAARFPKAASVAA